MIDGAKRVVVVGAGPAGLAVGAELRRRGVEPTILDRGRQVGDSWRWRYDRLHLHTPRVQSALPGLPIPRRFGRWVSRDDVIRYLTGYARFHGLAPRFGVEVERLDRAEGCWILATSDGDVRAVQVVVATGYNHTPWLPDWPGRDDFAGELLHASSYRSPDPFVGRDVLVVGGGNTGAELAADLAEGGAAQVRLSVRTPPHVIPRELAGIPVTLLGLFQDHAPAGLVDPVNRWLERLLVGDLERFGLPAPRRGLLEQFRATGVVPVIDVGLLEQLRAGRVRGVAAVEAFAGRQVVLADGSRIEPEVVIAATGYRRALEPLVGHLGVLDRRGRPRVHGADTVPGRPGLRFVGLDNPFKGQLLQINLDARAAGRAIVRDLGRTSPPVAANGRRRADRRRTPPRSAGRVDAPHVEPAPARRRTPPGIRPGASVTR